MLSSQPSNANNTTWRPRSAEKRLAVHHQLGVQPQSATTAQHPVGSSSDMWQQRGRKTLQEAISTHQRLGSRRMRHVVKMAHVAVGIKAASQLNSSEPLCIAIKRNHLCDSRRIPIKSPEGAAVGTWVPLGQPQNDAPTHHATSCQEQGSKTASHGAFFGRPYACSSHNVQSVSRLKRSWL